MSSREISDMPDGRSSPTRRKSSAISKPQSAQKGPDERTPLITTNETHENADSPDGPPKAKNSQAIVLLLVVLLILSASGDALLESPTIRIMESVICYRHFEKVDPSKILLSRAEVGPGAIGGVEEMWCKVEAVQGQLAMLQGYQSFLDGFPSLLLALPFGYAADKFGRKPLLIIGILSFVVKDIWIQSVLWFWQSFDIRWTWLSSAHGLMAGSSPVVSALFFTVVADIVPQDDRSAVFAQAGAASLLPTAFVPLIAAWLMTYNPWIPTIGGTLLTVLSLLLVIPVPETLNYRHPHSTPSRSCPASPVGETAPLPPDPSTEPGPISLNFAGRWLATAHSSNSFLWADWRVPALIATFFVHMLNTQIYPLLLQYISKRYDLRFSKATLALTVRAILNCAFLLLVLPWVSKSVQTRWSLSTQRKDIYLARASLALLSIGWYFVGASPNITLLIISMSITCFGAGAMYLLRSFLTSLVPPHHVARVFTLVSIVDTLGAMLGAPLLAALLNRGLAIGGMGIGLPFFCLGLGSTAVFLLVCLVGMRKGEGHRYQVVEQEG